MTNDGELMQRLLHPSGEVDKTYQVWVQGAVDGAAARLEALRDLEGEPIRPARVEVLEQRGGSARLSVTIHEGKNRQIRRMCEAVGLDVIRLRRSALGAVKLGMLQPGQYRELTSQEVTALRTAASRGKATATIAKNTAANAARRTAAGPHGPRAPKGAVAARKKRGGNRG